MTMLLEHSIPGFQERPVELQVSRVGSEPVTFSIFSCFLHIQPVALQAPDKAVILSGAPHGLIA
jgi:hypothetical protein